MSALLAARMGDAIGHTAARKGLLVGAIAGVALAVGVVAVVGTGGLAAVAVGAGIAAGGAGGALAGMHIGEMLGGGSCGKIKTGSVNTIIEGRAAARAGIDRIVHGNKRVAQGSATVFVNKRHLGRKSEKAECGGVIRETCRRTFIGGESRTVVPIQSEVPRWAVLALNVVAWGGAIVATGGIAAVAGWGVAIGGFAGSMLGGMGLGWVGAQIGGALGGELGARIGETIGGTIGGFLGGMGAAKLGELFARPRMPLSTQTEVTALEAPATKQGFFSRLFGRGGSTAAAGKGETVQVTTGLGSSVDALVGKSPAFAKGIQDLQAKGFDIRYTQPGDRGGNYTMKSPGESPHIVIDKAYQRDIKMSVELLSHEVGHGLYDADPFVGPVGLTREQFVSQNAFRHLKDEGAAVMFNAQARSEILANGGPDIGIAGAGAKSYQATYEEYAAGKITLEQAREIVGNQFGTGEIGSSSGKSYGEMYSAPYAQKFDELYGVQPEGWIVPGFGGSGT